MSRVGPSKVYVQNKMLECKDKLWNLISAENAMVFVCGSARALAADVRRTWVQIFADCGHKSNDMAVQYLAALQERGMYLEDCWG